MGSSKSGFTAISESADLVVASLVVGDRRSCRDGTLSYDTVLASSLCGLECKDPSLALQSQAEEADINVIVNRFLKTGHLPLRELPPPLEEFAEVFDFQSAQNVIAKATQSFAAMDAEVRARFGNDPHAFVNFCADPKNLDEMLKMGLAEKRPVEVESVQKVHVVNHPEAGESDGAKKVK